MPSHFKDWRDELENLDAELIRLLNRRVELATRLLQLLRREDLTLGLLEHDANRLLILLFPNTENGPLPRARYPQAVFAHLEGVSADCCAPD